jgi:hypothetical protein
MVVFSAALKINYRERSKRRGRQVIVAHGHFTCVAMGAALLEST